MPLETYNYELGVRAGQQWPLETFLAADTALQGRGGKRGAHKIDRLHPRLELLGIAGLEEVLRLISRLQAKHVLLLGVVRCLGGETVVYTYRIVEIIRHLQAKQIPS